MSETNTAFGWKVAFFALVFVGYGVWVFFYLWTSDWPERFEDNAAAFKYGSTGGDKNFGLPYVIWRVLPEVFPELLPDPNGPKDYSQFGFISETLGQQPENGLRFERPVGTSLRYYQGIERIFLNCAACHTGQVTLADGKQEIYLGMPANTVNLQAFQTFLTKAAESPKFNAEVILAAIDKQELALSPLNWFLLWWKGIDLMRERLLLVGGRLNFGDYQPEFGPGRFDTFSSAKALFNWPSDKITSSERVGVVDFPSIWLQGQRVGMNLHWDGNNVKLSERDRSASYGTGGTPPLLDREYLLKVETWLQNLEPPKFPGTIDGKNSAAGKIIYDNECASCHGLNGQDFAEGQGQLGAVIDIAAIGTDRARLDNFTFDLSVNEGQLYALWGEERFANFRKTNGYAAAPLDGIWLRAPYLHNGSVPTLWDLLLPPDQRPVRFNRGTTTYDWKNVGFVADAPIDAKGLCFVTRGDAESACSTPPDNHGICAAGACFGNGNQGHEYGILLDDDKKRQLIEYLKTF